LLPKLVRRCTPPQRHLRLTSTYSLSHILRSHITVLEQDELAHYELLRLVKMEGFASKLPFGHHKAPAEAPQSEETSLTTLLNADQCADLTLLIATITATMRKSLLDTFTAEETSLSAKPSKSEEQVSKFVPENTGEVDVKKEDKIIKERVGREKDAKEELAKPEVQELKKAMLSYFDEWRGKVVIRVGEVVNSRAVAKEQSEHIKEKDIAKISKRQDTGLKSIADIEDKGEDEDAVFKELYPPIQSSLTELEEKQRRLVLHSLVLILLSLEHYSAHSRILLLHITSSLHIKLPVLKEDEHTIGRGLLEAAQTQLNADAETKKKADESSTSRKWKVGLASVAGAALIGVTGGLAAPLLAAGIGTVMGGLGLGATAAAGYLGTLASSSVLVGGLFGAYGARMTGKAMDDYAREVEDFGFIPIRQFHRPRKLEKEFRRLRIAIAVSGWLNAKEDVVAPWRVVDASIEGFALRWELEALMKLGNSMDSFVKSTAWAYAKGQIIKRTIFGALSAGLWPLSLLKISGIIDNPFSVAKVRAEKGGQVLADALINKVQGERPVTLIGYSLGARLIFSCLQTLAERKAFGLIESVVLLGSPCPSDAADWRTIRSVVSGRVVNVFSTNDYILAFLYRTSSIQLGVAGLEPVLGVHGVQNIDVSELVNGHLRYRYLTGSILKKIGFEDIDIEEVEREEAEMKAMEELERKEREKKEGKEKGKSEEEQKQDLEKEVEKRNEESMMSWVSEKVKAGSIWATGGAKDKDAEDMVKKEKEVESAKVAPAKT
jgi:beta-lactamase superfamily II metal-dependent hydrolase